MDVDDELLKELRISRDQEPQRSMPRWLLPVAIATGLAAVTATGYAFFADKPVEVRTVQAATVEPQTSRQTSVLEASGYVVARRMATVSSQITGRVLEVLIEEGQHVQAGQILARLDPITAEAEQQLARSQLESTHGNVASLQAQLRQAESESSRLEQLVRKQLVSRTHYEESVARRDSLKAQVQAAERNSGVARDRLAISTINRNFTVVRAPFSGVVVAKAAQPGEIVSPLSAGGGFTRTGIGTIVDMDSLEIEVDVGEAYIGRVSPGMPVTAVLNAYPEWQIPAEVVATVPTADRGKATVKVRIGFKGVRDQRIVPEMGVRVSFLRQPEADRGHDTPQRGVIIPAASVLRRENRDLVFVVEGDHVLQREITIARRQAGEVEVSAGLTGGETLVDTPPAGLADGARVRPQHAGA